MIMCIQNLVKFCPFILKIWSKNLILESIKGRNSVANLRKNNDLHTNADLSMMICIQNSANSAVLSLIWPNFELVRDVIDVLVTCKYEEDPIKNEGARVDTTFSPL